MGFTKNKRALVFNKHGYICFYCKDKFEPEELHMEHVVPRSLGGGNELENLVPACPRCNAFKGTNSVEGFLSLSIRKYHELKQNAKYFKKIINNLEGKL